MSKFMTREEAITSLEKYYGEGYFTKTFINQMNKAIITTISKGKRKGEFRFTLHSSNGEILATGESYTQKHNCTDILKEHFPGFKIVDETKKKSSKKVAKRPVGDFDLLNETELSNV